MKKFAKRLLAVIAVLSLMIGLVACQGTPDDQPKETEKPSLQKQLTKQVKADDTGMYKYEVLDAVKEYDPETRNGETIFYGASNFALWETMEEDLAPYLVQNHAFGGSTDKNLLYWADVLLYPYNPAYVFFQTGSNDYVKSDAPTDEEKVKEAMDFKKEMFAEFHEKLPNAKFIVMSGILLPGRPEQVEVTLSINDQLKAFCDEHDYMIFIDAESLTYNRETHSFVDGVENLFVKDQIHLTPEMRIVWAENWIIPMLEELAAPKAAG